MTIEDSYQPLIWASVRIGMSYCYIITAGMDRTVPIFCSLKNTEKKLPQLGKAALWFYALFTQYILLPRYPSMSQTDTPNTSNRRNAPCYPRAHIKRSTGTVTNRPSCSIISPPTAATRFTNSLSLCRNTITSPVSIEPIILIPRSTLPVFRVGSIEEVGTYPMKNIHLNRANRKSYGKRDRQPG